MKVSDFKRKKQQQEKITMLTCYDYPSAQTISQTSIDCVLVGDSVAMAVHGHASTVTATLDMLVLHTKAVARGIKQQFIVSDLPFLCHKISLADTMHNVRELVQAGAHAVKIEGGDADTCKTIAHITSAGVPVLGHIGLTPQAIHQLSGYRVQGKQHAEAETLLAQAMQLQQAGVCALVIECVPRALAATITKALDIATIGIGAGMETDGQVLVWHDMLGLQDEFKPRFLKQFANLKPTLTEAINAYASEVRANSFPALDHCFEVEATC